MILTTQITRGIKIKLTSVFFKLHILNLAYVHFKGQEKHLSYQGFVL